MQYGLTRLATTALLLTAILTAASCTSSKPPEPTAEKSRTRDVKKGVPGGVVVDKHKITANVTAIDKEKKSLTLALSDGTQQTFEFGPAVVNFDQIKVGNQVKATVTEELAVYMATQAPPSAISGAEVVLLSPKGEKPGGVAANTQQVTATLIGIYDTQRKVSLQFPGGSVRTVVVRDDVDLSKRKVGEKVVIRLTQAIALTVEAP